MEDKIINVNFYGEKKKIKLNDQFDSFKLDLASLLGINEEKLKLLNIYYKDEDNDNIFINNSEDYKQLLVQINNDLKTVLEIEVKPNCEKNDNFYKEKNILNSNKNNFNNQNIIIKEINFEIKNINKRENNNYKKENEIIYPIICSLCKESNLKNVIYFCSKCKNYICSFCFEKIKMNHSHSFNIIVNLTQFKDINENTIFNENNNKFDSSLVKNLVSNFKDSTNNFMNNITNLFKKDDNNNNNNINYNNLYNNVYNNNYQQPNIQNNLNYYYMNGEYYQNPNNQLDSNIKNLIVQFRQNYDLSKFTDEQLKDALEKANWNMNNAIEKLF